MANRYWIGNGGNWSDTAHWSTSSGGSGGASYPLDTGPDSAFFDGNSFSSAGQTVTLDVSLRAHTTSLVVDWSNATNNPIFHLNNNCGIQVSTFILTTNMTITSDWPAWPTYNFAQIEFDPGQTNTAVTIDSKGVSLPNCKVDHGNSQDTQLLSNLVVDGFFTVGYGFNYFDANGFNVTCKSFYTTIYSTGNINGDFAKIKSGTGTWTITGYDTNGPTVTYAWSPNNVRYYDSSGTLSSFSTLIFTDNSSNDKTLSSNGTGSNTYSTFTSSTGGTGNVTIGTNTDINNLTINYFPGIFQIDTSSGNTFNINSFVVNNTSAVNVQTIARVNAGVAYFTFSKSSGVIQIEYCTISNFHTTGGATWYACNTTDSGNNTGWTFSCYAPSVITRYWVGGSGSWSDDNNHWATTSGGSPFNGNIPISTSNVFIDAFSGFGSGGTITVDVTPALNNFTSTSRHTHTLSFVAGSTFTVNELRLGGISTNHITFNSQTPGAQWNIIASQAAVDYVDLQDSFGKGNTDILVDNCGIDLGNNNGWHFICITGSGASKVPDPKMKAVIQQKTGGSVINFKGSVGKIVNPKPDNSIISFKGSGGQVIASKGT